MNLGGIIALVSSDHKKSIVQQPKEVTRNHHAIIFLKTRSLEAAYDNLKRFGATIQNLSLRHVSSASSGVLTLTEFR